MEGKMRNFIQGIKNLIVFFNVIWSFRHWDYDYQLKVIDKMLEICESNWGTNTFSKGDKFTKKRIQLVRYYYMLYSVDSCYTDIETRENNLKKFLKNYIKLLPRLWD